MTVNEQANNLKNAINETISLIGKEGCIKFYESEKNRSPKIYAYGCDILGCDVIEYANSL